MVRGRIQWAVTTTTIVNDGARRNEMTLHVRLIQEDGIWAAQCLEYDVCAQGKTRHDSIQNWYRTAYGQVALNKRHGKQPFEGTKPAPMLYWHDIRFRELEAVTIDPDKIKMTELDEPK